MTLDLWSPIAFRSSEGQTSKKLQEPKCFTVGYFLQTFDSLKKCFRKKVDAVLAQVNPFKEKTMYTKHNLEPTNCTIKQILSFTSALSCKMILS